MGLLVILFLIFVVWLIVKSFGVSRPVASRSADTPRVVRRGDSSRAVRRYSDYGSAPQPSQAVEESRGTWQPPGSACVVQGVSIPDGMVYVGERLTSLRGYSEDPALIDPRLSVETPDPDRSDANLPYWPSYSRIPAKSRGAYLQWLANGRREPHAYIGFVFLFFYGIERRVLIDAQRLDDAREEVPVLAREVENLLTVYGENQSFRGYASNFLDLVNLSQGWIEPASEIPPTDFPDYEIPFRLKYMLGSFVASGQPIPPDWALAWLRADPGNRLRTPGRRCPDEFDALFKIRYQEELGDGLLLKPNKTKLSVQYKTATASISGSARLDLDLPDVTALKAPQDRLQAIANRVTDDLDSYSRWVGRHDDPDSPAAIALLPAEIARGRSGPRTRALIELVAESVAEDGFGAVETSRLLEHWPSNGQEKLTKREAGMVADLLASHGYGIEPDPRLGRRNFTVEEKAVVFALKGLPPSKPSEKFEAAAVLLRLGATVAAADQDLSYEEESHLEQHLERALVLEAHERLRLQAYLRWLFLSPPDFRGLKARLKILSVEQRKQTGRFLIAVAGADGHVSASELEILRKIYGLLDLAPDDVFADAHSMASSSRFVDQGPATVIEGDGGKGYTIPSGDLGAGEPAALDHGRVAAIIDESKEAAQMLRGIFADTDEVEETEEDREEDLPGLDEQHSAFARALCEHDSWPRDALQELAAQSGLLPAGAIEVINEASFEICGEPLIEGWDPIEINRFAWSEMTG